MHVVEANNPDAFPAETKGQRLEVFPIEAGESRDFSRQGRSTVAGDKKTNKGRTAQVLFGVTEREVDDGRASNPERALTSPRGSRRSGNAGCTPPIR